MVSNMQPLVDELTQQAIETGMTVNNRNTEEMLIGSIPRDPPLPVTPEWYTSYNINLKLLGVHVTNDLEVDTVCRRISSSLIAIVFSEAAQTIRRPERRTCCASTSQ